MTIAVFSKLRVFYIDLHACMHACICMRPHKIRTVCETIIMRIGRSWIEKLPERSGKNMTDTRAVFVLTLNVRNHFDAGATVYSKKCLEIVKIDDK